MIRGPDLSVIIPCLNEEENITLLVDRLLAALAAERIRAEIILVDDGSKDGTWGRIQEQERLHPEVRGVRHEGNRGIAAGWESGFKVSRGKRVAIMDADLQYRPEDLVVLYKYHLSEGSDIVQGWRHLRDTPRGLRSLVSRSLGFLLRFLFSTDLHDIKSGFAVFTREAFTKSLGRSFNYRSFQTFIFINAIARGLTVEEVPVAFDRRQAGVSFIRNPFMRALKVSPDFAKAFCEFRLSQAVTHPWRHLRQLALALFITLGLLAILLRYIDWEQFEETFRSSHPGYLALGFGLLLLTYLLRVVRIRRALPDVKLSRIILFGVTAMHNFIRNIVPLRLGEFSFIYLINKKSGCGLSRGTLVFYVLAVADLISILLLAVVGISALYFGRSQEQFGLMMGLSAAICILVTGIFFLTDRLIHIVERLLDHIASRTRTRLASAIRTVQQRAGRVREAFERLSWPTLVEILAYSTLIWVTRFGVTYMILLAIQVPIHFHEVIIASAISILLGTIPIQGIAGFGSYEATWTIGFCAVGLSRAQAVMASLYSHITVLVYLTVLALAGTVVMGSTPGISGKRSVANEGDISGG